MIFEYDIVICFQMANRNKMARGIPSLMSSKRTTIVLPLMNTPAQPTGGVQPSEAGLMNQQTTATNNPSSTLTITDCQPAEEAIPTVPTLSFGRPNGSVFRAELFEYRDDGCTYKGMILLEVVPEEGNHRVVALLGQGNIGMRFLVADQ